MVEGSAAIVTSMDPNTFGNSVSWSCGSEVCMGTEVYVSTWTLNWTMLLCTYVWARTGEDEWAVGITVVKWFTPTFLGIWGS